jgi:hypothetical protein
MGDNTEMGTLAVTEELHAKQQEAARKEAERAARKAPQDAAADAKGEAGEPASKKPREKEPRASTTDAQARVMKMADGGFRPAYNVQFATDTKSTAIAGVSVDNIGSDMGKMLPMNDALAGQYGTRPRQHLADGGFAKLDDIEALAQNGVETFVPVPKPRNADRDRHAPQPSDPPGVADWRGIVPRSVELYEASVAVNDVKRPSRFEQQRDCLFPFRSEQQARLVRPEVA